MERQQRLKPFLKWAGGKRWLAPRLAGLFDGEYGKYIEPFLGSAAMFFYHEPKLAQLSDMNSELIACYRSIRDEPLEVERCLSGLAHLDPDTHYYDVRSSSPDSAAEKAAKFLYLNRTCWNGLYRVNKLGMFNVPRGTKNQVILHDDDFAALSCKLKSATLSSRDFESAIDEASCGDIIFCDPPYTVAHNFNGFVKYNQTIFTWEDQRRLAAALERANKRGAIVAATNADHPDVRSLYNAFHDTSPIARASIIAGTSSARKATTELLVVNRLAHRRLGGEDIG